MCRFLQRRAKVWWLVGGRAVLLAAVCAILAGPAEAMRLPALGSLSEVREVEPTYVASKRILRKKVRRHRRAQQHQPDRPKAPSRDDVQHDRPDTAEVPANDDDTNANQPPRLVCINGVVRARRCLCKAGRTPERLRPMVAFCAVAGVRPTLPSRQPQGLPPRATSLPSTAETRAVSPTAGTPSSPPTAVVPPGSADRPGFVADEVLVTLPMATPEEVDQAVAADFGIELVERVELGLLDRRLVRFRIPDGRTVASVVAALEGDARVIGPQPNYYYYGEQDAEGPGDLQYALAMVEAPSAHTMASGVGVAVAVVDSAVDTTHPDLADAAIEVFDAVGGSVVDADDAGHGTAIAGIIAAQGALAGVAPDSRLLSARAFTAAADGGPGRGTTTRVLKSIDWAVGNGARVINMSFSGPSDTLLEAGVAAADTRGAILVAAAGNGGEEAPAAYPAAYPAVIAVTAVDIGDRLYEEANRGTYIDLASPGVDVLVLADGHAHALKSGTSFAAAHVSGIIALMLERELALTPTAVRRALKETAHDLGLPGWDPEFGAGRANARLALTQLK